MSALSTFLQKEAKEGKSYSEKLREAQPDSATPKSWTGLTSVGGAVAGSLVGHKAGKAIGGPPAARTALTLAGGVAGGSGGNLLGQKLDKKFGFTKENNPNPKGNDRDGDGKKNEPKPFKSASLSDHFEKEAKRSLRWPPSKPPSITLPGRGAVVAANLRQAAQSSGGRRLTENLRAAAKTREAASAAATAATRSNVAKGVAATGAGLFGAGLTAKHLSNKKKDAEAKEASLPLSAYSGLFDQVVAGEFGKEASSHLREVCLGIDALLDSRVVFDKTAGYSPSGPEEESDEDSRKRRLAELLRKREHSGTATGSASPNPPKGA